jgi:hypothetical protein
MLAGMTKRVFRLSVTLAAAALLLVPGAPAGAQGTPVTPLAAGPNNGSADSFQGPHDWYFTARPGGFAVTLSVVSTSQDSAPMGGHPTIRLICTPKCDAKRVRFADSASGVAIRGSVARPTKMVLRVIPPNSPLVRVARNYTLEATGAVAFAGASGTDPIVGTYIGKTNVNGAARFLPNGSVITADGQQGRWVAFDPALHIYTITVGANRWSLKLVPGRGLVEPSNDVVLFETAH